MKIIDEIQTQNKQTKKRTRGTKAIENGWEINDFGIIRN